MNFKSGTGWSKVKLGDLFSPLKRKNQQGVKRVLTVSGELGLVDQSEFFDRNIASKNLKNYWLLHRGDFAYNRSFMKGHPFGAIKSLYRYDKGCVSPIYLCFALKDKTANPDFYSYIFESGLLNQQLMSIVHAGARAHGMLNVSQDEFFEMVVPKPPKEEQKKISEVLAAWDRAIEVLSKLINTKTSLKRGCMQWLLTGKKRLKGFRSPWVSKKLGEIGDCFIGLTYKPSNVCSDGLLVLRSSNIFDGRLHFKDNVYVNIDVPERLLVKKSDIIICVRNGSKNLIGKCALIDETASKMTFGAFMAVFRTPYARFVFYQFQSSGVKKQIKEHLGATINQITNKSLNSFRIPFPTDKKERTAIADILTNLDGEISLMVKKLSLLKMQKKALMQKLLTGKIRVVT